MSSFHYLFLSGFLLIISIALTNAIGLDSNCTVATDCGSSGFTCRDRICQCEAPWYRPCNGVCDTRRSFYQGQDCRRDENCVENSRCDNNATGKCICRDGFTGFNGLCYKKNNESCRTDIECWSRQCNSSAGVCTCRIGYEPSDDGRCKRKLVPLRENWLQANGSNDFCVDDSSCSNSMAVCRSDSIRPEKFCQCPSTGYNLNLNTQQCELNEIERLSPVNEPSPNDNVTCTYCKADNAVCAYAGSKTTCWCRAGYDKIGDRCGSIRSISKVIFPSMNDASRQPFRSNCSDNTTVVRNGLCVCADGYEFVKEDRPCKTIERNWISEYYEYGICTRITSDERAQSPPNNGLCPAPLRCRQSDDKNICSCGPNLFLERLSNENRCVPRLGKNTTDGITPCPTDAERPDGNNICRCKAGFKQVDVDERCELVLQANVNLDSCDGNKTVDANSSCTTRFGGSAQFCQLGVCRCTPGVSFANDNNSRCYGFLNVTQPSSYCPLNAQNDLDTLCRCKDGYRSTADSRRCEPKSPLLEWFEAPNANYVDLNDRDCRQLYTGVLAAYNVSFRACRCDALTFRSPDGTQCWPLLYVNLTTNPDDYNCALITNAADANTDPKQCQCVRGFRPPPTDSSRRSCAPIITGLDQVYTDNVHPINDADCVAVFGILSIVTNDSRCTCNYTSFPTQDRSRCVGILSVNTGSPVGDLYCPEHASESPPGSKTCECKSGFIKTNSSRECLTAHIPLLGTKLLNSSITCGNYTNDNCIVKYGDGSFCENNQCWCNGNISYDINRMRCENFSNYIFPGAHERNNFSCDVDNDCTATDAELSSVECRKISTSDDYKVCVCKNGWFLNPQTRKCEQRCPSACTGNKECIGYDCRCKIGYIAVNDSCVSNPNVLNLYQPCNASFAPRENDPVQCGSCSRGECASGYKDDGFKCVPYSFDSDGCVNQSLVFCVNLIAKSECDVDENKCVCASGYYRNDNACSVPVGFRCLINDDCGNNARCVGQRCQCADGKRAVDGQDSYGRQIKRCINNGVDQIRFSPVLLLFVVLARVFFA